MFWQGNEYDHIVYFLNEITKATGLVAVPETIGWYPGPVFPFFHSKRICSWAQGHPWERLLSPASLPCWPCRITWCCWPGLWPSGTALPPGAVSESADIWASAPFFVPLSILPRVQMLPLWTMSLRPGGAARRMSPGVPDASDQPPRLSYPGATTKTTQHTKWQKAQF